MKKSQYTYLRIERIIFANLLLVLCLNSFSQSYDPMYGETPIKTTNVFKFSDSNNKYISGYNYSKRLNETAIELGQPYNLIVSKKDNKRFWRGSIFGVTWGTALVGGVGYMIDSKGFQSKPSSYLFTSTLSSVMFVTLGKLILNSRRKIYQNTGFNELWLQNFSKHLNLVDPKILYSSNGCDNKLIVEFGMNNYEKLKELNSTKASIITESFHPINNSFQKGVWTGGFLNNKPIGKGYFYYSNSSSVFDGFLTKEGFPSGDGKYLENYNNQFTYFQSNFINGKPNGASIISRDPYYFDVATFVNGKAHGKAIRTICNAPHELNCVNGNCESAFLEEIREQRRNEIFAAIVAGAIVYKVGSWMLGNVSKAVSEHNQSSDNCSLEVDPECDGYDCFFFICNDKGNGRIIRIEQIGEYKYKVGAGDQIEYATNSSEAETIAKKLTQCNCN